MVVHLAKMGYEEGIRAFVCSPYEISLLRENISKDITIITPGIRLAEDENGDQKRVMTPKQAKTEGANFLVMGRSIIAKEDSLKAVEKIIKEIE